MKLTVYISILLLLSPGLAVGGRFNRRQGVIKRLLAPIEKRRGEPFNPKFQIAKKTTTPDPKISSGGSGESKNKEGSGASGSGLENSGGTLPAGSLTPFPNQTVGGPTAKNNPSNAGSPSGGDSGSKPEGKDAPNRELPPEKQGGSPKGSSKGVSFGMWWPVCIFVDGPDANSQVTEMVKMSAACGVNLKPYVRTVSVPNPDDPETLNSLQSQSCNIKEAGIAGKGSSLVLTNRSSTVADKMCGSEETVNGVTRPTTNVAGCNQLANGASGESKKRAESHKGQGDGFGGFATGEVAVGIVDSQGYSSGAVYSHEAMGHGQMGWPNGKKAGNGIGDPNDPNDSSGDHQHGGGYTGVGCAQMRASAIPDPEGYHKYYADKSRYYSHRPDKPMPLGEKIWKTFKDGPENNGLLAKNNSGSPKGTDGGGNSSRGTDAGTAGPGHKKPKGIAGNATGKRSGGRIGDGDSESDRSGASRGGDDSSDGLASQVNGDPSGGPGDANSTIVANRDKSALNGSKTEGSGTSTGGSTVMDSNFLGSSSNFGSSEGVSGIESRESTVALNSKGSENSSNMDPDYLAKKEEKERRKREKRIRKWSAEQELPQGAIIERAPSSRRK